jgi:hypothetical protein
MIDAFNQIKSEEEENRKTYGLSKKKKGATDEFFNTQLKQSIRRYQPSYYISSSIHSTQRNIDNSISISLNCNKIILDNEESILSIHNILNAIEKKSEIETNENKSKTKSETKSENRNDKNMRSIDTPTTFGEAEVASVSSINTINSKNKLKTVLSENVNKIKNFPANTLNLNNLNKKKISSGKNSPHVISNNVIVVNNKNNEKTIIKKLPLKQLNLAGNSALLNDYTSTIQSNTIFNSEKKITEASSVNSTSVDKKKLSSHRVTSSIPEIYNTVKIINNYPNIIIPSGSTHVSINQNYYNYGTCQSPVGSVGSSVGSIGPVGSRIIMIEHFDSALNTGLNSCNNTGMNIGLNTGVNSVHNSGHNTNTVNNTLNNNFVKYYKAETVKKTDEERPSSKNSHKSASPNYLKKYASLMKDFSSPKISAVYNKSLKNSVLPNPVKSQNSKIYSHHVTNSNTNTINANSNSIILSNTNTIIPSSKVETVNKNSLQIYSKVLKIFQENYKVSNGLNNNYKTIENNKVYDHENIKKRRERNDKEVTKNDSKLLKVGGNVQQEKETIKTERESKSRIEIKEEVNLLLDYNILV